MDKVSAEINREYTRLWRLAGKPAKIPMTTQERLVVTRAVRRKSRNKHRAAEIQRSAAWHAKHRREPAYITKNRARARCWRATHPEQVLKNVAVWQAKNPEKVRRYKRKWKQNNIAAVNAHTAHRRARLKQAALPGTQWEILEIYKRALWWCEQGFDVEVDHIYPPGFGWHEPSNLQIIYKFENQRKNTNPDYKPSVIFL